MPKVLITGGAGYIGSHAVKLFLEQGYEVVVFDNLSRGYRQPLEILGSLGKLTFVQGDLRNRAHLEKVFVNHQIDLVLHFAALCSPDESMREPGMYFANNVFGTLNLLGAMRQANVKQLVFSSTCSVYGDAQILPVTESHSTRPISPYAESKLSAEKIIQWYGKLHDLRYVILRYFNVCGADRQGLIGDSKQPSILLVQNAVRGALGLAPFFYTFEPVQTVDGSPIRDYVDVEDLAQAHFLAAQHLAAGGSNDIFNLGSGQGWSVKEVVKAVEEIFNITLETKHCQPRQGEMPAVYADIRRAKNTLNWQPKKSLRQSIESLRQWYEKHPDGYVL